MFRVSLLVVALSAAPASAQPITSVAITLSNFNIAPAIIRLPAGQMVRLVFTNASGGGHDFTAPAFFEHARGVSGPVTRGEVELAGHATATVTLTSARGTYKAKCTHFAHKMMGMSATIVVD
jgi:plastocyanin